MAEELRLPPFKLRTADSWFKTVERQFRRNDIWDDDSRVRYVVGALSAAWLRKIQDILHEPDLDNRYTHIKELVLKEFHSHNLELLRRLNRYVAPTNVLPSKAYRSMVDSVPAGTTYRTIQRVWYRNYPQHRILMDVVPPNHFQVVLDIADKDWTNRRNRR